MFPETQSFRLAGLILLGLSFNRSKRSLRVHAICASEVDAKDKTGLSDPYVEIHLGPGTRPARSPTDYKTLNPYWNHQFNMVVPPQASMLYLSVFDWDRVGRDLIGVVNISIHDIHGDIERWFPLNSYAFQSPFQFMPLDLKKELDLIDAANRPLRKQLMKQRAQTNAQKDWDCYLIKYESKQQEAAMSTLKRTCLIFTLCFFLLTFILSSA